MEIEHISVPSDTSSTGTAGPSIAIIAVDTSDESLWSGGLCEQSDIIGSKSVVCAKILAAWTARAGLNQADITRFHGSED